MLLYVPFHLLYSFDLLSEQKSKEKHYDIIVIASLGCVLIAGMFGGLVLNIYRKLRQDRKDLLELKVKLFYS